MLNRRYHQILSFLPTALLCATAKPAFSASVAEDFGIRHSPVTITAIVDKEPELCDLVRKDLVAEVNSSSTDIAPAETPTVVHPGSRLGASR